MPRRGGVRSVAAAVTAALALAGCSGSGGGADVPAAASSAGAPTGSSTGSPSGTAAASAYPTGVPSGVPLTGPGEELSLGERAAVAWEPRQGVVGTISVGVERVEPTTFKKSFRDWKVDKRTRSYTPYFVHASVTNLGTTDLAGVPVPLYGESAAGALVEPAVFKETFKPCHPSTFPTPFPTGAVASVCLVYLVPDHGELVGAAFRPTQDFDPIVWTAG